MYDMRTIALVMALALISATGGYLLYEHRQRDASPWQTSAGTDAVPEVRPEFTLPDLESRTRSITEWDGKVLLINFWATWCPPCKREIPAFIALQEQYGDRGFQVIGVAIDDPDAVADFADTYGIEYPLLVGDLEAIEITKRYGNRFGALPYSVITDRTGRIVFAQRGELTREKAESVIRPLL